MFTGKQNFSGGITTLRRVSAEAEAILAKCDGFDPSDGSLVAEALPAQIGSSALSGTTPEQTPFAFLDESGDVILLARDASEHMATFDADGATPDWSTSSLDCDVIAESIPSRLGGQVIFPTGGADPKLMAYEPGSASTKLRPLSFKSPSDYELAAKPVITPSADPARQLFDMPGNAWTPASGEYTYSGVTDIATFGFTATSDAGEKAFTKDLGSTGIVPGKYLILDVYLSEDPQIYETAGVFANDPFLGVSGYEFVLYSDQTCTTVLQRLPIPKIDPLGQVHRICFRLSDSLALNIKGVSIDTASFFVPPTTGTYTMRLYSYAMSTNWNAPGNWLLPAIQPSSKSPWADILNATTTAGGSISRTVPRGANLITTDNGFEAGTAWTFAGGASRKSDLARTGTYCAELDNTNESIESTAMISGIAAGGSHTLDVWYLSPDDGGAHAAAWRAQINWYTSGDVLISSSYFPGPLVSDVYYEDPSNQYRLKQNTVTAPATAAKCKVRIEAEVDSDGNGYHEHFRLDDIELYQTDSLASGSAWVLQRFAEGSGGVVTGKTPSDPAFRWLYCFCGRDLLRSGVNYALMVSNPSDPDHADADNNNWVFADPWRTFSVAVALPGGPLLSAAVNAGGTGYALNDVLTIADGTAGKVRVSGVNAGVVTAVTILEAGTGYTTTTGAATIGGSGTGCTINTTALTPITEYGNYLTHILIYRQVYDGESETWSSWKYIGNAAIGASMTFTDAGNDDELGLLSNLEVPIEAEIGNVYAPSARYAMVSDGRVYAGCLNYDPEADTWLSRTAIHVSSWGKPWAFPVVNDQDSPLADGAELDGYAVTGSDIRGLIARGDEKFVFLDNEFFLLRGDNPQSGWQFIRLDSIGCVSARTIADCRSMLIWHDGHHFYGYSGGLAQPISRFKIDSALIDFTKAHNAVYWQDKYILFCEYDDVWSLLIYDIPSGSWRIRTASAMAFVGICTDGAAGRVFGVSATGQAYQLLKYTGAATAGYTLLEANPARAVWTQYVQVAPPGVIAHISDFIMEVEAGTAVNLTLTFLTHGLKEVTGTTVQRTVAVATDKTQYLVGLNLNCDAVQVKVDYTGVTPPTIYYMGFNVDDVSAQGD